MNRSVCLSLCQNHRMFSVEHGAGLCLNLEAILIALEHRKTEESDWSDASPPESQEK